jgi:hypothetical protein
LAGSGAVATRIAGWDRRNAGKADWLPSNCPLTPTLLAKLSSIACRKTRHDFPPQRWIGREQMAAENDDLGGAELASGKVDGRAFFQRNFFTAGLELLVRRGFDRLAGKSEDGAFYLTQAMGGGKTHSLIAFGLQLFSDRIAILRPRGAWPHSLELRANSVHFRSKNADSDCQAADTHRAGMRRRD